MIILNETKVAEEILSAEKLSKNVSSDVALLARYFVQKKGMTKKPAIAALDSFLRKAQSDYNRVKSIDFIEKVVGNGKKRPLLELEGITITKGEMDYIQSLDGVRKQRVAFVMLCYAKFSNLKTGNNGNWSNAGVDELFKEARVPVTNSTKLQILREMTCAGVFSMSKRVDASSMKVHFVDDESEVVLFITDTRELAYEYMRYCGENIVECKECGRLIKGNKQNTKTSCEHCLSYEAINKTRIVCVDCGEEFIASSMARTERCDGCKLIRKRSQSLERVRKARNRKS